jgi:hypothetical protein
MTARSNPMKTWLAMLALCLPMASHAVNKCTGPDGRVVYSDLPCPVSKEAPRPAPAAASAARPAPAKLPPLDQLPPTSVGVRTTQVDFGRGIDTRLTSVVSLLDSMALDGRNCEAALKADERKVAPCVPFATVMQPGREWSQALYEMHALLKEPGLFERRRAEFAKASALIETISGHSQFMERRLGVR